MQHLVVYYVMINADEQKYLDISNKVKCAAIIYSLPVYVTSLNKIHMQTAATNEP